MSKYEGRLELTWTNKHLRLLAREDGSYEWVSPSDYRVAEVRLLHDISTVGDTGRVRAGDNLLIKGDALNALTSLARLPEFASEYLGKVKLAYLDPPFNTQQAFEHYDDALEHSVWLTMMRDRLLQIRDLLSPDGSVWLHLDDAEVHHARTVLDEVFGPQSFVGTVVWQRVDNARSRATQGIAPAHDFILVYGHNPGFRANQEMLDGDLPAHYDQLDEQGNLYCSRQLRKTGSSSLRVDRPGMWFPVTAPDGTEVWPIRADGTEGRWQWGQDRVIEKFDTLDWKRNRAGGWEPFMRIYPADQMSVPFTTWWPYDEVGSNRVSKLELGALFPGITLFSTPKPEQLLQRIINIGSEPGDIILDCFVGSGTTAAVAHKMGRRWIAIEREPSTIETFTIPRLQKVVAGVDPGGVTTTETLIGGELPDGVKPGAARAAAKVLDAMSKAGLMDDVDGIDESGIKALVKLLRGADKTTTETVWHGGGGFRVLNVAPSMFEADGGLVFLANWMSNGLLAEATAAQLGFTYESDPPFSGRKGRTRLVVVDGVVNEPVVRLIVSALPEKERVVVCGTGIDTDSRPILRELRPGSTLRKIPAALLDEYRSARQLSFGIADLNNPELIDDWISSPAETK